MYQGRTNKTYILKINIRSIKQYFILLIYKMSSTSKLMFTPYTDANAGVTGTPIELVFESGRTDGWDELTDGDVSLPPGNPDGNSNFIAWNAPNTASTGGKVYTLNGDSLAERSFEIRVENGNANLYIEFDPAELIANFDKVIILDALAPTFPAPPGPPAASGANATIDLLTESRSGAYTAYSGYYEFSTSSTGKRRIGIVSSLLYFIQVIPKAGAVSDSTSPVITLNGSPTVNLTVGDSYTEAGATATDETDGSVAVTVSGSVDTNTPGTYTLTYSAQDAVGNPATPVTRTVIVSAPADSTAPVITLNGQPSSNHEVGSPYTDPTTAIDNADGDITSSMTNTITKDGEAFGDDVSTIGYVTGTYVITYNVSDAVGNAATPVTSTVTVADTLVPTMELQGDAEVTITVGQSYSDAGVIPDDTYDQSPTISITITKDDAAFNDDIITIGNAIGTYVITYTASDAAGNTATPVTRTVTVEADTTAPVISLTGASTITLTVGEAYTEYGATATDTVDGTVPVTIGGTVDTGVAGTYTLTYDATDAAQNTAAQVTRTVTVVAATDTTWGDITNDGSIGAADVVYLASYLAGESGFIHGGPSAPAS